jgi:predicted DNA-binding transcriptional regulator AlpA
MGPEGTATAAMSTRRLLDVHDVAALMRCSWRTVLRLADAGKLPWGVKIGGLRRWDSVVIDSYIANGCPPVRGAAGTKGR